MTRLPALMLLAGALALPPLPVHADATGGLFDAAWENEPAVVAALLAAGGKPNARDEAGWTALLGAAGYNLNPSVIEALIEGGADVNARGPRGWTPLHATAWIPNPEATEALLAGGADPNARDEDGKTPLHVVAATAWKLDEWSRAEDGKAAEEATRRLWALVLNRTPSVIEALLDAGADAALRDEAGKVPFDYAKDNEALRGTEAYWRLNDGRFE